MRLVFSILSILLLSKPSLSQDNRKLIGTWKLRYSLQADKKKCDLPKDSTILVFNEHGTYYWNDYGAITIGRWKILNHKLRFSNIQALNFKAQLSDVSYLIELTTKSLVLHRPEGIEIPCIHEYYVKAK